MRERAIKSAYDRRSGRNLDAEEEFRSAKQAHVLREQYNNGELDLYCCECGQPLHISKSIYDRVYFKHAPYAAYCVLKDSHFSVGDMELIRKAIYARESERHKYLKCKIADLLSSTYGVDQSSVIVDSKFIFDKENKRRPDVYCVYQDKQLVFEIQLSPLPLRYLLHRHNFYKNKGVYLIWILDDFDVYGQSSTEKDIKYLNAYHNYFTLDETAANSGYFRLLCDFKNPMIHKERSVISPWTKKSVSLEEIQYCADSYQIYYLDFEKQFRLREEELRELEENKRIEERKRLIEERQQRLRYNADRLVDKIKEVKTKGWTFYSFSEHYAEFYDLDTSYLNDKLGFNKTRRNGKSLLNYYIATASEQQHSFIQFLLQEQIIYIDVNLPNDDGSTMFQEIFQSRFSYKDGFIRSIFQRNYKLTEADKNFYISLPQKGNIDKNEELFLIECMNSLHDRELVDMVWQNSRLLCLIESAKRQEMVGFRYTNWISLGILAITSYQRYWDYIEAAFKKYGLWEKLITNDRKGTFQKKLTAFYETMPEQDFTVDELVGDLYGDLSE